MREPSAEETARYRRDGFLVIEGFLSDAELAHWREVVDKAVWARDHESAARPQHGFNENGENRALTQRLNLWQTDDGVRALVCEGQLPQVAGTLAGVQRLRLSADQALIKEPFADPTGFHADVPIFSFDSADGIGAWIALDDATADNGCLYYVPGSHSVVQFDLQTGAGLGGVFQQYPDLRDVAPVACPVRAGGALFHNGLTIHGAGANMTNGRRRAMTAFYMPDGSTFNGKRNILTDEQLAMLSPGDPLGDDAWYPLVFVR